MSDWNAERYHELSSPQQAWGRRVLERIQLTGGERVLDLGCGTGRLTAELARRVPGGRVIAADRSTAMLETASRWLRAHAPGVRLAQVDGAALPFNRAFDAIFSNATFHWIPDHAALFRSLVTALVPGGRLVSQCGGGPNIALLYAHADAIARRPFFAHYFSEWTPPGIYADVEATRRRMHAAGFVDINVWLEAAPTSFDTAAAYQEFVATVCLRQHLSRLPSADRPSFLREVTMLAAADDPPFTLDYWRLNIDARRPAVPAGERRP